MSNVEKIIDPVERMAAIMARAAEATEAAVAQHGNKAVELALLVARMEAIQVLVTGALSLGLALLCAWLARRCVTWGQTQYGDWDDHPGPVFGAIFSGAAVVGFGAAGLLRLASLKAWVGAFVPEYWIAAKALESLL